MSLPFGLEAWFPLTEGVLHRPRCLGQDGPATAEEARSAWQQCSAGEALVLVDELRAPLASGLTRRFGRRSLTARLAAEFRGEGRVRRWRVLPGTGGSHVLLPARPRGVEAGLPMLPGGRRRWRHARRALLVAERLRLVDRIGFGGLLVAVKGSEPALPACPWIAARPHALTTVALGVPGLLRKATLRVSRPDGSVEGFLKLPLGEAAQARVLHEADTLEHLARLAPGMAPRLLARGNSGGRAWLVQAPLSGARAPDRITSAHVDYLAELARCTETRVPFAELGTLRVARERIDTLRDRVDPEWTRAMDELADALHSACAGREIPCALAHGDFTPWNLVQDGPRLAAFDWEFADSTAPLLSDLVHFHLQTGILVRRAPAAALLAELEALCSGPARGLLHEHGASSSDAHVFIGLELLRAATADERLNSIELPPFAQVDWLRRTRVELAQLVALELRRARAGQELRRARAGQQLNQVRRGEGRVA